MTGRGCPVLPGPQTRQGWRRHLMASPHYLLRTPARPWSVPRLGYIIRAGMVKMEILAKSTLPQDTDVLTRAQGCLLGQLAGDALGSLVEFQPPEQIRREYPDGVRELAAGGTWNTIAGQPTDDSEMALLLARMLAEHGRYDSEEARKVYVFWLNSGPFDCGMTISSGLRGRPNPDSQANGAMMRISPLGIFGANHDLARVAEWARQDAAITHPHPVCRQASAHVRQRHERAAG